MKNHLVSDNNYNIVNLQYCVFKQRMMNNFRFTFSVGGTTRAI